MRGLALICLLGAPAPALAQVPLPFLQPEKPKAPPEKAKPAEPEEVLPPKIYTAPAPRPLPEGPAVDLAGPIVRLPFDGIVNPGMGEAVASAIEHAERGEAQAVLIELDTPGGLVSTTEHIVQAIMAAKVPVIVFVSPSGAHAASAGAILTLSAHVAAMAPATRIGAAHPVTGSGEDPEAAGGKHMGRKVENDLAALVEGIAAERNRNVEWAIDAVRDSVSVPAQRALEIGVIDLVARDVPDLLAQLDGRELVLHGTKVKLHTKDVKIVDAELSIRERLVNLLANPGIAMLLGLLGLIGIMVEIYHPGMIAPGVMGVLCIICSLIAMEQLPIDVGAAILVVGGIGLLVAELYASTYGALGILGFIGLVVGLLLLVDPSDPSFLLDSSFRLTIVDVAPVAVVFAGFVAFLSVAVLRVRRRAPTTGPEGLLGQRGVVLRPVDETDGMILLQGEYWRARASERIEAKEEVEVTALDGLRVTVRRRRPD